MNHDRSRAPVVTQDSAAATTKIILTANHGSTVPQPRAPTATAVRVVGGGREGWKWRGHPAAASRSPGPTGAGPWPGDGRPRPAGCRGTVDELVLDLLLFNVEQLRYVVVELTIGRFDRLAGGLVGEGPHLPGVEPPGELQCSAVLELFIDGEELLDLGDEVSR